MGWIESRRGLTDRPVFEHPSLASISKQHPASLVALCIRSFLAYIQPGRLYRRSDLEGERRTARQ